MIDDPKLILPDGGNGSEPLPSAAELSAAMEDFERTYPDATWQTAGDEVVKRYTAFARQAARHLAMLHYEVASMIYQKHIPLFSRMGDSAILCVVACLHFSRAGDGQAKKEVMENLNAWSVHLPAYWHETWLASRWKPLYGAEEAQALFDLWYKLHDLHQFYLSRPEWG